MLFCNLIGFRRKKEKKCGTLFAIGLSKCSRNSGFVFVTVTQSVHSYNITERWSIYFLTRYEMLSQTVFSMKVEQDDAGVQEKINQHNRSQQHEWSEESESASLSDYINWVSWYWSAEGVCNFSALPKPLWCPAGSLISLFSPSLHI